MFSTGFFTAKKSDLFNVCNYLVRDPDFSTDPVSNIHDPCAWMI
jgi:hypothetical protein